MTNFENPISRNAITEEEIRMRREQFKNEAEEYKGLLKQLQAVKGLKLEAESPKASLAFLIEKMKKKNPDGWREDLKRFRGCIDQAARRTGKVDVTWVVAEATSSTYIEFLERKKREVQDESLKRKLEMIKEMAENSLNFNRKTHAQGQPVAFGGVSLDYIPQWYYYIEK